MQQPKEDRATGDSQGAGGSDALAGRNVRPPYTAQPKLKLVGARRLEVVHRFKAGAQNWTIVLSDGASRKIVSTFTSKGEAIEQLGFFSKELRAQIAGRGAVVTP
jgi:hypothetical protein